MDLSSWQSKLEAPVETVDGLDSSSEGETDEEDSVTLGDVSSTTKTEHPSRFYTSVVKYVF